MECALNPHPLYLPCRGSPSTRLRFSDPSPNEQVRGAEIGVFVAIYRSRAMNPHDVAFRRRLRRLGGWVGVCSPWSHSAVCFQAKFRYPSDVPEYLGMGGGIRIHRGFW